jgi:hypothetical protein
MINHKSFVGFCLAVLCFAGASSAFAGPIVYLSMNRSVDVVGTLINTEDDGSFNAIATNDVSWAAQDSFADGWSIGGSGFATTTQRTNAPNDYSESGVDSTFRLDEAYQASFYVSLLAFESGQAIGTLYDYAAGEFLSAEYLYDGSGVASFQGVLAPGMYNVTLYANGSRNSATPPGATTPTASFDGGLTLTPLSAAPVPEPASMTMVGLGLVGAGLRRLKSRRKPTPTVLTRQ